MRKTALYIILCILCYSATGQIKISELPTKSTTVANGYIPVVVGGVTYKLDISNLPKLDTFYVRNDTLFGRKAGLTFSYKIAGSGTSINYYSNGATFFTDTIPVVTDGTQTTIKIYTGGKVATSIQTVDENGSGFSSKSGTVGDTTYIYYTFAPTGTVYYILTGQLKPLEPPSTFTATPESETSIALLWNSVPRAIAYELQYSYDSVYWGTKAILEPGDTTYLDTGLVQNQTYHYRMRGLADSVYYVTGNFVYASATTAALAMLTKPSLTVNPDSTSNTLNWTNVANETGYGVQYSSDKVTWIDLPTMAANETTYTHTGLAGNTKFYYQLKATADYVSYRDSDYDLDSATTFSYKQQLPAPNFRADAVSFDEIDVYIDSVAYASSVILQYLSGDEWETIDTVPAANVIVRHSPLNASTLYQYRSQSISSDTNYLPSAYAYDTATTFAAPDTSAQTLPAPVITATATGAHTIEVEYDATANATGIVIERSVNNTTWTAFEEQPNESGLYEDTGLMAGTKYYYRAYYKGDDTLHLNSPYGYDSATTTALSVLATPTLTAAATGTTTATATVSNVANETGYTYLISPDKATWSIAGTTAANVTTFTFTNLTPGTKYYFQSYANGDNITYSNSPLSNIDSATTTAAPVTLITPTVVATANGTDEVVINHTNVPNESGYVVEKSSNNASWIFLDSLGVDETNTVDTGLLPNTTIYYRVYAYTTNPAFLNSGYGWDSAHTGQLLSDTRYGVLTEPGITGYTQANASADMGDSTGICIGRIAWIATNNNIAPANALLRRNKELTLNINSRAADTAYNYVLPAERAKYVHQIDTLFTRHLVGKNDTLIVVGNELANREYKRLDTAANSPTNSAKLYYYNELKVVDSIAKLKAPGQFRIAEGGATGKHQWYVTWDNYMDSGRIAEANEIAYAIFTPAERKSLPGWETGTAPMALSIKVIRQLHALYRADTSSTFKYVNVHPKLPYNGIDSVHINANVLKYLVQAFHNLTGKEVISNEWGTRSTNPGIIREMAQFAADNHIPYWIGYDGIGQVSAPNSTGKDVSWRKADGKTLNGNGIGIALQLLDIQKYTDE